MEFFWYHNFFFYIYHKVDFFIQKNQVYCLLSQNRFCDIKNKFAYIKFDFVISQSGDFNVSFRILSITTFICHKPEAQA